MQIADGTATAKALRQDIRQVGFNVVDTEGEWQEMKCKK